MINVYRGLAFFWGEGGAGSHDSPSLPPPTPYSLISEPNKVQKFQFQTSRILLLANVQKLHEPGISQFLPCTLQFLEIYGGFPFFLAT